MLRTCFAAIVATSSAIGPQAAFAQALPTLDTARVLAALEREARDTHAPGASIAVVIGDRIAFAAAIGTASVETGQPMTPQTLVRIGSVTKSFTGITAALMAHAGDVDLDAPVGRRARGLHPSIGERSLTALLGHAAGLTNEAATDGLHDDAALGARVRSWKGEHVFAPVGDVYSYSSPGYWLAGYVLEQAGKRPYADLVRERLLEPLGMSRSTFRPTTAMTYPLALDHRVTGDTARVLRPFQDDVTTWPSGSLFSSSSEMARLAIALMNGGRVDARQALPAAVVERVMTRVAPLPGNDCGYSFGLSTCTRGDAATVGHYGFRVGSGAVFTMIPDKRVAVIVLSNRNGGIMRRTEQAVLDMLVPVAEPSRPAPAVAKTSPSRAVRESVAGDYVSGADTLRLALRADSLVFRFGRETQRARLADSATVQVLDAGGAVAQEFTIVRGAHSGSMYLHDGLSAFRRVRTR